MSKNKLLNVVGKFMSRCSRKITANVKALSQLWIRTAKTIYLKPNQPSTKQIIN